LEIAELGAIRQAAVPQQVAGFLEGRIAREIVDVVSAIREHAAIAVEKNRCETTLRRRLRDRLWAFRLWPYQINLIARAEAPRRRASWPDAIRSSARSLRLGKSTIAPERVSVDR
jgi:hypothetical protein